MSIRETRRVWLFGMAAVFTAGMAVEPSMAADDGPPDGLIGYTQLRTDLPGGRHANVVTMRAMVVKGDGTGRREIAKELVGEANAWTQFAGWSPDGKFAVIGRGWESAENGAWEESHKTFRFNAEGWLCDSSLVELSTGKATNLTKVERVSYYNTGLFVWPGDPKKLGFQAMIDGNMHPFSMDRDGRNKRDLTRDTNGFTYGFVASPDGKRIAYHKSYQVYVADADGSNPRHIKTGDAFAFVPQWSADSTRIMFVAGPNSANAHPYVAMADGSGIKKIADRAGYRGGMEFLDVFDFHTGSSDLPVWSVDGKSVFYTANVAKNVELFRVPLDGKSEQMTDSKAGTLHYHPQPSPDGKWLAYGSKRDGVRQLFAMRLSDRKEFPLTAMKAGHAALWAHWQPK